MAAGELSNQVYTAPQAPNYLHDYAEIMRSIPDPGKQMAQAQLAQAQIEKANADYEFMKQKAKSFTERYPAFKAYQDEKWRLELLRAQNEAGLDPYRRAQMAADTELKVAKARDYTNPPPGGSPIAARKVPPGPTLGGGGAASSKVNPFFLPYYPPGSPAATAPPPEESIESDNEP